MKKIRSKGRIVDMGKNLPMPAPRVFDGKLASFTVDGVDVGRMFSRDADLVPGLTNEQARAAARDSTAPPPYVVPLHEETCVWSLCGKPAVGWTGGCAACEEHCAYARAKWARDKTLGLPRADHHRCGRRLTTTTVWHCDRDPGHEGNCMPASLADLTPAPDKAQLMFADEADTWDRLVQRAHQRLVDTIPLKRDGEAPIVKLELLHDDGRWRYVQQLVGADITGNTPDEKDVELRFRPDDAISSSTTTHLRALHQRSEDVWLRFAGSHVYKGRVVEVRRSQQLAVSQLVITARVRLERTEGPPAPKNGVRPWKRTGRQDAVDLNAGDEEVTT